MTERVRGHLILAGVLILIALIYLPSLANFPVADSWVFLEEHSFSETLGYFSRSVIPEEWNALWFRPLPMFSYWLDTKVWNGALWVPHLTNLLFHLLNTVLIWILVRSMSAKRDKPEPGSVMPAFVAALIYGLHPLCVGAVVWIAARFDLLCVTCGLGALYFWERWDERSVARLPYISLGLLAGSLLSKEQGVVFIAIVILSALYAIYTNPKERTKYLLTIGVTAGIFITYVVYRLYIFQGIGGYLDSVRILSLKTPVGYLAALFFPYRNLIPHWHMSIVLVISAIMLIILLYMLRSYSKRSGEGKKSGLLPVTMLFLIGLITTAPHAGLAFMDILGHIESRFALIAVTGLALTVGRLWHIYVRSAHMRTILLGIVCIWGISALWRTDVQIYAWHTAGETARHIVDTTVSEIPEPVSGSALYYFSVPSYNSQFAYIFGIGLKEALMHRYTTLDNVTIYPRAQRDELQKVRPDIDVVFGFNRESWQLERLRPQNQ